METAIILNYVVEADWETRELIPSNGKQLMVANYQSLLEAEGYEKYRSFSEWYPQYHEVWVKGITDDGLFHAFWDTDKAGEVVAYDTNGNYCVTEKITL